jgi:hypothetical protein
MEYVNSQEVLDFNVYMSKNDHFSFTIFQHPDGDNAALVTRDNTCTVPALGTATGYGGTLEGFVTADGAKIQPFLPYQYDREYNGLGTAAGFTARSQVGHIEVIEMGVLTNENAASTTAFNPAAYATHGADGIPANCAGLVAAWDPFPSTGTGQWTGDASTEITNATGGLYGLSNVLDSADAAGFGIDPAAIDQFWGTNGVAGGKLHTNPGTTSPSLGSGDTKSIITAAGQAYTLDFNARGALNGWDAVSSLIMASSISNDVMINPVVGGMTDWVVTFPTKREYVNTTTASTPFGDAFATGTSTKPIAYKAANLACEGMTINQWNREESTTVLTGKPVFSPAPPTVPGATYSMCLETNTLAIGATGTASVTNTVLATTGAEYLPAANLSFAAGEVEGWMRMGFSGGTQELTAATSVREGTANGFNDTRGVNALGGLPVMGFAAFKYANADRSYGFVSEHKSTTTGSAIHSST